MTPRTIPDDSALPDVREHIGFTFRRLRAHALTLALAQRFEELLAEHSVVHQQELALGDALDEAIVVAHSADQELNAFATRVSNTIRAITGNQRTGALYKHFFDGEPLHIFTRPLLGDQLAAMHVWVSSLTQSEHADLQALGAELPALLEKADAAALAKRDAEQAKRLFKEVGARKKLIDDVNAARKETYGALAKLPHQHPGLPSRFADGFFRRDRVRKEGEPTIESVSATIASLQDEIAEQQALLAQLQQEQAEAKAAAEEQARLALAAELAEIQKEIEEKQKQAAALQAALQPVQ